MIWRSPRSSGCSMRRRDRPNATGSRSWPLSSGAYERKHHPMTLPDPIDAIKFRMEQARLKQVNLIPAIGSKSRVSEVLRRRRPLTLPMIRRLARDFGIPLEVLVREDETAAEAASDRSPAKLPRTIRRRGSGVRTCRESSGTGHWGNVLTVPSTRSITS
jgi:antitoxin component HigA of HigAB toxin-antitoxin module